MTRLKTKVIRVLIFLKTFPKASQILIVLQCLVESSPARGFSEVNNVKEREREKKKCLFLLGWEPRIHSSRLMALDVSYSSQEKMRLFIF